MNNDIKLNLNEDILYQIAMIIYDRHNSNIASINDHLGEVYSYKDLEESKRYELEDEKHLLELAIKQLQQENQQLKKQLKQRDVVIDEIIEHIKDKISKSFNYDYGFDTSNPSDRLFTETVIELEIILDKLKKYKGDNNEL